MLLCVCMCVCEQVGDGFWSVIMTDSEMGLGLVGRLLSFFLKERSTPFSIVVDFIVVGKMPR